MTETERVLHQHDLVMHGDAWHGDSIREMLDDISPQAAAPRARPGSHTIWEIVMHMTFWEGVATKRLNGQRAGLDEALNFPATPQPTASSWQKTRDEFYASNELFRQALARVEPARLDELSPAGKRTMYEEAHGVIQHHVYHAGQIALLLRDSQRQTRAAGL